MSCHRSDRDSGGRNAAEHFSLRGNDGVALRVPPALSQGFSLTEGAGQEIVETTYLGAGYTRPMVDGRAHDGEHGGAGLPGAVASRHLTTFPEKSKPAATIIPGPLQVSIKEWPVPKAGLRPHDPFASINRPNKYQ
jgi:hypothetical protein